MKNVRMRILISAVFGLLFAAFTLLVRSDHFDALDFAMTVKIQDHLPTAFDEVLKFFSFLARFEMMVLLLVLGLVALRQWFGLVMALGLFFWAHVTELIGKYFLHHPPPPFMFYRHATTLTFPDLHTFDVSSYPSGHSMRMTFIVIVFGYLWWQNRRLSKQARLVGVLIFAVILGLTLFSRVSLGEHWTSDVIGGALLGACVGTFGLLFLKKAPDVQRK